MATNHPLFRIIGARGGMDAPTDRFCDPGPRGAFQRASCGPRRRVSESHRKGVMNENHAHRFALPPAPDRVDLIAHFSLGVAGFCAVMIAISQALNFAGSLDRIAARLSSPSTVIVRSRPEADSVTTMTNVAGPRPSDEPRAESSDTPVAGHPPDLPTG
jgi:hypothetical protein